MIQVEVENTDACRSTKGKPGKDIGEQKMSVRRDIK